MTGSTLPSDLSSEDIFNILATHPNSAETSESLQCYLSIGVIGFMHLRIHVDEDNEYDHKATCQA